MIIFNFKFLRKKKQETTIRTIVLDTSALNSNKAMRILEEKDVRVILLTGIILEMDNWKHDKGVFGDNIKRLSRKCREDQKSKKYVCVSGYDKHSYQDKNIIEYCKDNPGVTIITADNNLCNLAKAFDIPYIYVEKEKEEKVKIGETSKSIQRHIETQTPIQKKQLINKEESQKKKGNSYNTLYISERVIRFVPQKGFFTYIKVETQDGIVDDINSYKEGDSVYEILCSKKGNYMEINRYKIILINNFYKLRKIDNSKIYCMNEIFKTGFSEEIQDEILKIFKKGY